MTPLEHFIFGQVFPAVYTRFATASDDSFIAPHSLLFASWNTIYIQPFLPEPTFFLSDNCLLYRVIRHNYFSQQFTRVIIPNAPTFCDRLYTVHCCQLEHYIFYHFHQSLHSFYLITVCNTVCYTGQFRHSYFSQQFTRVFIPNAPTVCDRLLTVHCLEAGTLYTWPFSPEPIYFLFYSCLLYRLLYWAISA